MSMKQNEFFLALNQVATERGISADDVIESIKMAVLAAYKKDFNTPTISEETPIEVKINKSTGETHIFIDGADKTPAGFGRIASQTARQVILQNIRETEKKMLIRHYQKQAGSLVKGRVIKFDGKNAYLDIGKAEAFLPFEEQMQNESYALNTSFILVIKEVREDQFSNFKIIVSRADPLLIADLFRKEVPEVEQDTVKIYKVVREPGYRAKIAVHSDQRGVDPVGACVGQKGIRVKTVTETLGGNEKIDIIQYHEDPALFIREALAPTQIQSIEIEKERKHARVYVDESQAPLAIGKKGINVNLASQLTGYEIDIIQTPKIPPAEIQPESKKKVIEPKQSTQNQEK